MSLALSALVALLVTQSTQVRVMMRDGDPWFVAKDVCEVLGLNNVSLAVNGNEKTGDVGLDADEKDDMRIPDVIGRQQSTWCVNESGLYHLIFKSRKDEAKTFRRWVTHEVLPAVRKTGTYAVGQQAPTHPLREKLYDRLVAHEQHIPADCFTPGSVAARHLEALMDLLRGLDASAMPERSMAQHFARYAKEDLHLPEEHRRRYSHVLPTGRIVQAWAYDRWYLPLFVQWLWTVYFPQHFPYYARYRAKSTGLPAPKARTRLPAHTPHSQVIQTALFDDLAQCGVIEEENQSRDSRSHPLQGVRNTSPDPAIFTRGACL